jgi:hypothetical protein
VLRTTAPLALIAALLLSAGATPAAAARPVEQLSVAEYLKIKNGEVRVAHSFLPTYLDGVREGLFAFDELAESLGLDLLCVAQIDEPLGRTEFRKRVDEVIEEAARVRPDFETYAQQAGMGVVGLFVLNQAHPCKRGPASGLKSQVGGN